MMSPLPPSIEISAPEFSRSQQNPKSPPHTASGGDSAVTMQASPFSETSQGRYTSQFAREIEANQAQPDQFQAFLDVIMQAVATFRPRREIPIVPRPEAEPGTSPALGSRLPPAPVIAPVPLPVPVPVLPQAETFIQGFHATPAQILSKHPNLQSQANRDRPHSDPYANSTLPYSNLCGWETPANPQNCCCCCCGCYCCCCCCCYCCCCCCCCCCSCCLLWSWLLCGT